MVSSNDSLGNLSTNTARFLINYGVRFIFGGLVLYCCWEPLQSITNWFSWHVILCTIGYIPLMAEAIMLFLGNEIWSRQVSRKAKYSIHATLIFLSVIFIIVGNSLIIHYREDGHHFNSVHGITGLVSMIILIISLGLGSAVNSSEEMKRKFSIRPVWFKLTHNVVGIIGFVVGIVSLCFGYYTNYFVFYTTAESRTAALIATIAVSFWSLNGAMVSAYNQIKTIVT